MKKKKAVKAILIILVLFIVIPVGKYYIIGPRNLTDGGEIYSQKIYYMFNTYNCVGWTMDGNYKDLKTGRLIKTDLFSSFYFAEGNRDYIIVFEPHEKFIYKKSGTNDSTESPSKPSEENPTYNSSITSYTFTYGAHSIADNDEDIIELLEQIRSDSSIIISAPYCKEYVHQYQCINVILNLKNGSKQYSKLYVKDIDSALLYQPDVSDDDDLYIVSPDLVSHPLAEYIIHNLSD